jgi:hypothetical protein
MEISKMEKSFDSLFRSLYGETFLVGNAITLKYTGLGETLIIASGRPTINPLFDFISTRKSFSYEYLMGEVSDRINKVLKYLSFHEDMFNVSFNVPDVYLTEEDTKRMENSLSSLKKLTFYETPEMGDIVGEIEILPLNTSKNIYTKHIGQEIIFRHSIFIESGWVKLGDDSIVDLPTESSYHGLIFNRLENEYYCPQVDNLTQSLDKPLFSDSMVVQRIVTVI